MIVLEFKVKGKPIQYQAIDEAIQTAQFVRNKCLRFWMDNRGVGRAELYRYNTQLRAEFPFVKELNSHACQASVERCWSAIARFFDHCKQQIPGKKGYPNFKKHSRSVEYKTSGWTLSDDRKRITFTDGKQIGKLKLIGTRDLNFYQSDQIKRVRLVRRADGYYCQFCVHVDVQIASIPTQKAIGIDLGLKYFLAYSNGEVELAPQFYRKAENQLNRANRKKSKKYRKGAKPQSKNYHKARNRYARNHLRVSRQREEYCKRVAYSAIQSNDLVAYEDLNVKGLVRNRHLAKSISDAGWYTFRKWLEYFGRKYGKVTVAVPPHYTSQNCSSCGTTVKKSLSVRTHLCPHCGYSADRDLNAALNILQKGLTTVGHTGSLSAWGDLPSSSVGENLLGYGES
ncbi:RNA-guided endonuclease InsQ/TnpB family protein [Pantanalinema rosaneae CENA516]|uniref:RNA-guided endonuclease InsQ/TnpB family protein n=1 Tax=Pantanalinema rosaneae TaxID=1620701 RepID=UPI003D6DFF9F